MPARACALAWAEIRGSAPASIDPTVAARNTSRALIPSAAKQLVRFWMPGA